MIRRIDVQQISAERWRIQVTHDDGCVTHFPENSGVTVEHAERRHAELHRS